MSELLTNPSAQYLRDHVLWRVRLNNDKVVYQHDTEGEPSSWLNLKNYLDANRDQYIVDMHFVFRDHYEHIGYDAKFFFFTHKVLGHFATEYHQAFYVGGCGNDIKEISCKHFVIPDLLMIETDVRHGKSKLCNRGIIAHPDYIGLFDQYYDE
jgi:hypothetical protein